MVSKTLTILACLLLAAPFSLRAVDPVPTHQLLLNTANQPTTPFDIGGTNVTGTLNAGRLPVSAVQTSGNFTLGGTFTFTVAPAFTDAVNTRLALGLGSAATHATGEYATAAQGSLAATAAPRLTIGAVQTSNATLIADTLLPFNCTSGNLVASMPASPTTGMRVAIKKVDSSANTLTITAPFNGNTTATALPFRTPDQGKTFVYDGSTWWAVYGDLSLAALDLRYSQIPSAPTIAISGNTATITASDAAAEIHYTTDGTTPTVSSALYTGAITLTGGTTVTVKAIAYLAPVSPTSSVTATLPDADYSAYTSNVASAGGTMTTARQSAVSALVSGLKSDGTWNAFQGIWAPATDTFSGALVALKAFTSGGSSTLSNTGFVSGDYAPSTGLLGASGKYLDTGFNYSSYGSSVAGYMAYVMDDAAGTGGPAFGTVTGTGGGVAGDLRQITQDLYSTIIYNGRNFGQRFGSVGNSGNSRALLHIERNSLTSGTYYVNGVSVGTDTGTMTSSPQNLTAKIFGQNNSATNTTVTGNYAAHLGFFAITNGTLNATQAASVYARVKTFVNALGRSPKSTAQARMALTTGQSLAVGSNSTATLSTTQPYTNKQVNTANAGGTGSTHYPLNLTPLVEGLQVAGAYESIGSGMANQQASLWRADHPADASKDLIVSNAAVGATTIATRTSKTPAGSIYNVSLQEISDAMAVVPDYYSGGFVVAGINQVDGESDASSSTFAADLLTLYNQYQTDIQALTGQASAIPMLYSQISAWTATGNINAATAAGPIQQLTAYETNPTKLVLVGPKYIFTYGTGTNDVHLTQVGYRWLGEYYGKVWDAVVNRGGTWSPLRPTNITRSGATITVTMTSGTGTSGVAGSSLVLDTTSVTSPNGAADGFEWSQSGGTAQTISSVSVSGSTVTITLTGDPGAGSTNRLRYAYTGTAGNAGGPTTGPRGCLRDSDAAVGLASGNHLYNWCVTFDKSCP